MPNEVIRTLTLEGTTYDLGGGDTARYLYENDTVVGTDNEPYLSRACKDIGNGYVSEKLIGATYCMNQLIYNGNFTSTNNWSRPDCNFSVSNNVATITAYAQWGRIYNNTVVHYKKNHIYYATAIMQGSTNVFMELGSGLEKKFCSSTDKQKVVLVVKRGSTVDGQVAFGDQRTSGWTTFTVENAMILDITQMFGGDIADKFYELEQAEQDSGMAWLQSFGFLTQKYYDYSAGKLQGIQCSGRVVSGKNLINPDKFENGLLNNDGTITSTNNWITSEYIPVSGNIALSGYKDGSESNFCVRFCQYNNQKIFIQNTSNINTSDASSYSSIITLNSNTKYVRITFGFDNKVTTPEAYFATNRVQLEKNIEVTTYEPYTSVTFPFDQSLSLHGGISLDDDDIVYDGGDTYEGNGKVTRAYGHLTNKTGAVGSTITLTGAKSDLTDIITTKGHLNEVGTISGTTLTLTTAFSNDEIVYELATPTTETANPFPEVMLNPIGGTETFLSEIPVPHEGKYYTFSEGKFQLPTSPECDGKYVLTKTPLGCYWDNTLQNDKVLQNNSSINTDYRVLLSGSNTDNSEITTANKSNKLKYNPSKGSLMVGENLLAGGSNQTVLGKNNVEDSSALLVIGKGSSSSSRSNALKVDSNGNLIMSTQIKTSFHESVAPGSYQASANNIEGLVSELRYSSGAMGSVSIGASYTKDGITIGAGWYNFLWVPHRTGGINGNGNGDNTNYGSLYLTGMSVTGFYLIRYSNSVIAELKDIYHLYGVATTSANGLMSSSDKSKLDGIAAGAEVNVQSDWNQTTNTADDYIKNKPQNLVQDASYVHTDNNFTTILKNKLDGIANGAEVNQNAFSNVKVGSTTIAADAKTDTLELAAGDNITLTPDDTNDKVTIAVNGLGTAAAKNATDSYSSTGTDVTTGKAVAAALGTLDVTGGSSIAASKTISAWSETDGKVSISTQDISITKSQVSDFPTLGTAAAKDYTTSVTQNSTDLVTSGAVWTAIDNLPEPMIMKGTLGTNGTITSLPTAAASNEGFVYKVITAGTYASQAAKVGDFFVSCKPEGASAYSWVWFPSGDESFTDTWRNIKINGTEKLGTGISSGAVDFINGTNTTVEFDATGNKIKINSSYTDTKVTAVGNHYTPTCSGSYSADASGATAAWSIDVVKGVKIDKDAAGHITGVSVTSGKIPANPNTDTKVTAVGNHYTPTCSGTFSKSATGATASWNLDVVTGVTLQKDAAGHIVDLAVSSGKVPGNPNTDTKVTAVSNHYTPTCSGTFSASATGATAAWSIDVVKGITLQKDAAGHITGISVTSGKIPANPNTDRYVNSAVFADDTTNNANSPVKMTLTRAGSDTTTVTANIPKVSSSGAGVVPKGTAVSSQSQSTKFLREDGTWAAPSYTTDTNNAVTQTATNTNANYEVLFSATADNTTRTEGARKYSNLLFNPSTGNLQATQLNGVDIGSSPKFTDNDTKNTAGSTNSTSKLYLIGATSQAANPQTYSNSTVFTENGYLNVGKKLTSNIINNFKTGTGYAAEDKGSSADPRYFPARWSFNFGQNPSDGDVIYVKLPCAGHDWGDFISTDNGTTYKPVALWGQGTSRLSTHFGINSYLSFVYDANGQVNDVIAAAGANSRSNITGGCWRVVNYYDTGNNYDRNRNTGTIKCGTTAIVAGNIIVGKDGVYHHLKDGTAFDINYPILYANAALAANATGNNNYDVLYINITTTQSITLTAYKPVYIKGSLDGSIFTPESTTPLTQTVPSSEDNKYYMLLGMAINASEMYLNLDHSIYRYLNSKFQKVTASNAYSWYNHTHTISQVAWPGGQNLIASATANSQEWSIDLTPGSYTGTYWHVWSGKNSKSILSCYPDDNSVKVPSGSLTVSGGKLFATKAINQLLTGTGTAAQDKGSGVSPRYFPAKWTMNVGIATPADGDMVTIKIPCAGHDFGVFLSLDNGTTYKPIGVKTQDNGRLTTHYPNGRIITLIYDSTAVVDQVFAAAGADARSNITGAWKVITSYMDGNYYDRNVFGWTNIKAWGTALTAGNIIVGINGVFHHLKEGTAFDITYPILYLNANVGANGTNNNVYDCLNFTITTTQSITLTQYLPVYIKGTLSGTTFTPVSTTPLTQTVPTTADGYTYIELGIASSTTAVYMEHRHKILRYLNGKFGEVVNAATWSNWAETASTARKIVNDTIRMTTADTGYSDAGLRYYLSSSSMTTNKPTGGDGKILHMPWDYDAWASQLYIGQGSSPTVYVRSQNDTTWGSWYPVGKFTQTAPTTGQVVVTDGTAGGIKSSGYTIAKSVPSDAVFTDNNNRRSFYGTCSTAAATAAKEVTLTDTTGWELKAGTIVGVKFSNSNTASNCTLNVNGSGAKSIWYNDAAYTDSSVRVCGVAGKMIYYMYDGSTYWVWLGMSYIYDTNTDTNVTQTATTTNALYEVLFSATADNTTRTEAARKNSNLCFNPSNGLLRSDYYGSASSITSRLTSLNFSAITNVGAGRTAMRLDLVSSTATTGAPPAASGKNSSGYMHTYYWDNGGVMTQLYIPNGDHVTTNGPQGLMYRGYDGSNWSVWKFIPFMTADPTSGQVLITDGTYGGVKSSGYTIATSVPSGAAFTDTKVTQNNSTTNASYRLLLSANASNDNETNIAYKSANFIANPNTGNFYATNVTGTIIGTTQTNGTSGGISLYNGTSGSLDDQGIYFRVTSSKGKHGYVQGDWATYFTCNAGANRGWMFRTNNTTANVASISNTGNAVFNGSITVGGNATNTSGARMEFNSTNQCIDFVFV